MCVACVMQPAFDKGIVFAMYARHLLAKVPLEVGMVKDWVRLVGNCLVDQGPFAIGQQ